MPEPIANADALLNGAAPAAPAAGAPAAPVEGAAPAAAAAGAKPVEGAAPVEGEFGEFKLPDGVVVNDAIMGDFKNVAKELGLKQDGAQKVVDLGAKMTQSLIEAQAAALQETVKGWTEAAKTDKEFGGEKFAANLAGANQVLSTFGSPDLVKFLAETGLSQHPEMIRFMHKVRGAVSEDKFVSAPQASKPNGRFYDKSNHDIH